MNWLLRYSAVALSALLALPASAAVQRTFVASFGLDTNPCSITAPCRTFAAALAQTNAGGEIIVLDSAGYGPVSINQSVSIIAPEGVYAGVTVTSGIGVDIHPGAGGKVALRGVSINGQGAADTYGIRVSSGAQVQIQRCTVSNMNVYGIYVIGGDAINISGSEVRSNAVTGIAIFVATAPEIIVSDTRIAASGLSGIDVRTDGRLLLERVEISDNDGPGLFGQPETGKTLRLTVRDSRIANNAASGIWLVPSFSNSQIHGVVEHSVIAGNHFIGLRLDTGSLGTLTLTLDRSVVSENSFDGVYATGTNATVYVRDSVVVRNAGIGLSAQNSGVVNSCGNNLVALNAGGAGNATPVACNQ